MADNSRLCLQCGGRLITVAGLLVHAVPPPNDHLAVPPVEAGGDGTVRQRLASHARTCMAVVVGCLTCSAYAELESAHIELGQLRAELDTIRQQPAPAAKD